MATSLDSTRLTLRLGASCQPPHGAWWPQNRTLSHQLTYLFNLWPSSQDRISRIVYSPPDWDDRPDSVQVNGHPIKTGSSPSDDTHSLTLVMHTGKRLFITVIPPATPQRKATTLLDAVAKSGSKYRSSNQQSGYESRWETGGGRA